mgnify:FL=1|jgi:hypothetical protein
MPLSGCQYAKLTALLQYWGVGTLTPVTRARKKRKLHHIFMPVTKLEDLLKKDAASGLQKIIQTAQNMDSLTGALRAAEPREVTEHIVAANVRADGELIIICSSSAWAARLRFESESLLEVAHGAGFAARSMRVTVTRP